MHKGFLMFCWIGLMNAGWAVACDIENKREISVGVSKGVSGECSNNASSIQCIDDGEGADRFTCDGPEGSFSGPDLLALISTACGCGADQNEGSTDQLQQELGNLQQD
jgi:hypothetical protein